MNNTSRVDTKRSDLTQTPWAKRKEGRQTHKKWQKGTEWTERHSMIKMQDTQTKRLDTNTGIYRVNENANGCKIEREWQKQGECVYR